MRVRFDDHANRVVTLWLDANDTSIGCGTVSPAKQSGLLRCVVAVGETHDATVEDVRLEVMPFSCAAPQPRPPLAFSYAERTTVRVRLVGRNWNP
jgi:hypothetical protein